MSIEQETMEEIQIKSQYNDVQSHEKQVSRMKKRNIDIERRRETKKEKRLKAKIESSVQKKTQYLIDYHCNPSIVAITLNLTFLNI
jgi:hypothetical protein